MVAGKLHDRITLNSSGNSPGTGIATGSFITQAWNMEERRRLSLTVNMNSGLLGVIGGGGGYTGLLQVQGTDDISNTWGTAGNPGAGQQPGQNQGTGSYNWAVVPIPSGAVNNSIGIASGNAYVNITSTTPCFLIEFTDFGPAYARLVFNQSVSNQPTSIGSGVMEMYVSSKAQ